MTVGEAAEKVLGSATYDTALPQRWVDACVEQLQCEYREVGVPFVWAYDNGGGGRPCALTQAANVTLARINEVMGSCWPLTPNPADA